MAFGFLFFHWFLTMWKLKLPKSFFRKQKRFLKSNKSPIVGMYSELLLGNCFKGMRERQNGKVRCILFPSLISMLIMDIQKAY